MRISERETLNVAGKVLLFAGVGIVIALAYYINGKALANVYVNWDLINTLLLWLIFVVLIIMVNKEHIEDIKYLRKISHEQLLEMRMLRKAMSKGR